MMEQLCYQVSGEDLGVGTVGAKWVSLLSLLALCVGCTDSSDGSGRAWAAGRAR